MINRIIMELYDDYEKGNIDSLIEFTKKTLPSDGTDKLFIGCVLILFSKSSSRYYATREELLSIVKAAKENGMKQTLIKKAGQNADIIKFANKSLKLRSLTILANIGLSSFLLAYCLPKAQFIFREWFTGSKLEPGLIESQQKNEED